MISWIRFAKRELGILEKFRAYNEFDTFLSTRAHLVLKQNKHNSRNIFLSELKKQIN